MFTHNICMILNKFTRNLRKKNTTNIFGNILKQIIINEIYTPNIHQTAKTKHNKFFP